MNLAETANREKYENVLEAIDRHRLPLPLVAVNGEVKMAGGVDYYAISAAVEKLLVPQPAA